MRLSICIPLLNRSRFVVDGRTIYAFPNCVRAIAHALAPTFDAEIVVADWDSTDWPLAHWVHLMAAPVPVRVIHVDGDFSVGRGFNIAADHARADRILFLGADMLVSKALFEDGHRHLDADTVYFPLVWSYTDPEHADGEDRPYGRGNVFMTNEMREELGPWREFKSHGKGDDMMWARVAESCYDGTSEQRHDFFHQWHPNDTAWKNQNYPDGWEADHETKEAAYAAHTL